MTGLKAQVKSFLRDKGIKTIQNEKGQEVKLQNAKTADLIEKASKIKGFVSKKKRKCRTTKKKSIKKAGATK